jgi:signal transduction histidine kinase
MTVESRRLPSPETCHVDSSLANFPDGPASILEVRDDGIGFTPDCLERAVSKGHIGLAASRERVEALGRCFEILAGLGTGTVGRATLPSRRRSDRGADAGAFNEAETRGPWDRRSVIPS